MDLLFDWLMKRTDENKQYFSEAMFQQEIGNFILMVLMIKEIVTKEELLDLKKQYIEMRNKQIIEELQRISSK